MILTQEQFPGEMVRSRIMAGAEFDADEFAAVAVQVWKVGGSCRARLIRRIAACTEHELDRLDPMGLWRVVRAEGITRCASRTVGHLDVCAARAGVRVEPPRWRVDPVRVASEIQLASPQLSRIELRALSAALGQF